MAAAYLHKAAEPGGVVIPDSLGVAESLQDGVGLQDLLLHPRGDVCCYAGGWIGLD